MKKAVDMTRKGASKRITIKDIASEAGVSLSTVSLILNDHPRISEATRSKVMEIINKYGYRPNMSARGLASRSSRLISVVVPALNHVFADVYFGQIVSGIYERAISRGYKVLLDLANDTFVSQKEHLNLLLSRRVDAMLYIGSAIQDKFPLDFSSQPYPFLLVNHYIPGANLNYVALDYDDSATQAAHYLADLGHRVIGLIAGTNTYTGLDFRDGFIKQCLARGLGKDDVIWVDGGPEWSLEGGFEAARALLKQRPDITAIMGANDRLAMGALRYVQTAGRNVPRDVSVMGVDDIPGSAFTTPSLSTIRHNLAQLGEVAVDRALGIFRKEISSCFQKLPVTLVRRESTLHPPGK